MNAGNPAEPNAPVSWLLSCGRSRTAGPLPDRSIPRDDTPAEHADINPLRTSPAFHQVNPDEGYRRSHIGPPKPDDPAASVGEYCSAVLIVECHKLCGSVIGGQDNNPFHILWSLISWPMPAHAGRSILTAILNKSLINTASDCYQVPISRKNSWMIEFIVCRIQQVYCGIINE